MVYDPLLIDSHKMNYHLERTLQYLNAKTMEDKLNVYPIYLEISPFGACNHRCTFCAVDYIGYKSTKLQVDVLINALKEAQRGGLKSVMFAGEGEPTLHPHLSDMINLTKALGIDLGLTTNGTGMNEKFIRDCLHSIDWIKISLNAGEEETYSKIHRTKVEDWKRVWSNITFACAFKEINSIKTKIGIQSLLLPENCDEMELLVTEAKCAGVDYVVIKPYSQHNSSINKLEFEYKDFHPTMERLENAYSDNNFQVIWRSESAKEHDTEGRTYSKCHSTPYLWAYLMATGDLYSCSAYLLDERFLLGNINSESFRSIWGGKKREAHIGFIEKELDISECRKNCRMDKVNKYLWDVKNPGEHVNFI